MQLGTPITTDVCISKRKANPKFSATYITGIVSDTGKSRTVGKNILQPFAGSPWNEGNTEGCFCKSECSDGLGDREMHAESGSKMRYGHASVRESRVLPLAFLCPRNVNDVLRPVQLGAGFAPRLISAHSPFISTFYLNIV